MFCCSERVNFAFTCCLSTVTVMFDAEAGTTNREMMIRRRVMIAMWRKVQHCSSNYYALAKPEPRLHLKFKGRRQWWATNSFPSNSLATIIFMISVEPSASM